MLGRSSGALVNEAQRVLAQIGRPINRRFPELEKFLESAPPEVVRELHQLRRGLEDERMTLMRKVKEWWRR